jgi:hypothetical protein
MIRGIPEEIPPWNCLGSEFQAVPCEPGLDNSWTNRCAGMRDTAKHCNQRRESLDHGTIAKGWKAGVV